VNVDLEVAEDGVKIYSTVKIADRTGVEMEALTAVSIAALTIIDMTKALDPAATIEYIQVDEKDGGRNGHWKRT
jgi:cyclic pyranopterin phosphate synthase